MAQRPYIVGNWKMNGSRSMLPTARAVDRAAMKMPKVEVAIAPPFPLIHTLHHGSKQIEIGAQDCHFAPEGAYTGDVSAPILLDSGARFVILGHSERRQTHSESDALVRDKVMAALSAGLRVILCVGESEVTRNDGWAEGFVTQQIRASLPEGIENAGELLTIAYEPIWAIGTGRTPVAEEIAAMHKAIGALLAETYGAETAEMIRILYGGSVNADNASEILAIEGVGGALVGGASLTVESFVGIVIAANDLQTEAG